MEVMINVYKILVRTLVVKRQLGSRRRRLEDNNRMGLTVISWEGVDWIHVAQDREQ
jgi:hypothetical protein